MFESFGAGMLGFARGARWLFRRPFLLSLCFIPFVLGFLSLAGVMSLFFSSGGDWIQSQWTEFMMTWFSEWQNHWYGVGLYWIFQSVLLVSAFILACVFALMMVAVVAAPVNEYISVKVERDLLGVDAPSTPWREMPRVIMGEFIKALLVLLFPTLLLLVPGVNLFAGLLAAFLVGWDFYDYPLARRGWGFRRRWFFALREFWTILGFGLWLVIPVVHIFLMPLAVAGGTILNLEAMSRKGLVRLKEQVQVTAK